MFIIGWFLSSVVFLGDFDCFCTKLVIFMVKCRVCRGFLTCLRLRILVDSDDTMIYCLYRVWRWRGLKRWITWLINQNNWVRNSIMMMFSTKILTSFVTWIKKSPKTHCVGVLFFDDSSTLFDGFRVLWKFLWILIVFV